jgi:hypothetical protein
LIFRNPGTGRRAIEIFHGARVMAANLEWHRAHNTTFEAAPVLAGKFRSNVYA